MPAAMRHAKLSSPAKINLDLRVLGKRADGYHELRTVFQTIALADTLEVDFEPARKTQITIEDNLNHPGLAHADNLVVRAAEAVLEAMKLRARIHFRLTKRIPMGAGLGGGSSNAAAVLLALPVLAGKYLELEQVMEIGGALGSDVPFFLLGGTVLGLDRGTELYPVADLAPEPILLAAPPVHVSTAEAYRSLGLKAQKTLTDTGSSRKINDFRQYVRVLGDVRSASSVADLSRNDFEAAVFRQYPSLRRIHRALGKLTGSVWSAGDADRGRIQRDAGLCRMTGSGSAMFCWFRSAEDRDRAYQQWNEAGADARAQTKLVRTRLLTRTGFRNLWRKQLGPHLAGESGSGAVAGNRVTTRAMKVWPLRSRYGTR